MKRLPKGDAGSMLTALILTKRNPEGDVAFGVDNTLLSRALDEGVFAAYTSPLTIKVPTDLRLDKYLFSESSGFVMEATKGKEEELKALFAGYGLELAEIGEVTSEAELEIETADREFKWSLAELKEAWLGGLPKVLE